MYFVYVHVCVCLRAILSKIEQKFCISRQMQSSENKVNRVALRCVATLNGYHKFSINFIAFCMNLLFNKRNMNYKHVRLKWSISTYQSHSLATIDDHAKGKCIDLSVASDLNYCQTLVQFITRM